MEHIKHKIEKLDNQLNSDEYDSNEKYIIKEEKLKKWGKRYNKDEHEEENEEEHYDDHYEDHTNELEGEDELGGDNEGEYDDDDIEQERANNTL